MGNRVSKLAKTTLTYYKKNGFLATVRHIFFNDYARFRKLKPEQYEEALKKWYKRSTGKTLDLENPKTFNEKIQWLKLYDSTPLKTQLADKYLVREWVKEKIGEQYLIPLLGVWDHFDDIDFDQLPDQFVLKANHGSGWNIIVKDKSKFDVEDARQKFKAWLNYNFAFRYGFELQYLNIPPKIIAEQYMADLDGDIYDYRFFCFSDGPKYVWLDIGSGTPDHKRNIYDLTWKLQDYHVTWPPIEPSPEKPSALEEMISLAKRLSEGLVFARVDFYFVGGRIYFGEMTFTPQSGIGRWDSPERIREYGDAIQLPAQRSPIPVKKRH